MHVSLKLSVYRDPGGVGARPCWRWRPALMIMGLLGWLIVGGLTLSASAQVPGSTAFDMDASSTGRDLASTERLDTPTTGEAVPAIDDMFDRGLAWALVLVFLLGLALNLTPCVYPMLAVTVSIFGGQSEKRRSLQVFGKALVYVLGIATMYSVLGVAAAMTGGLFGALMQSWVVLVGIAILFLALAFSMFGFYEMRLPTGMMTKLGGAQGAGLAGTFVSGLLVGVFAAPCIGPPIIGLLILVGQRADLWFGFLVFFVMSLGLGLPYLVLGTFSGLLQKLPRSGEWMVWVRKVLGLVLVAIAFFYLSLAIRPSLMFILIPLTLVLGGVYLGFFERSRAGGRGFTMLKRLVGIATIIVGVAFFMQGRKPSLEWKPYTPEALADAGHPAVVYFSADWCIPCLEMDRFTFTEPAVMRALARFVSLKADMTHSRSDEVTAIRERYGIRGVPTMIFLDAEGREVPTTRRTEALSADALLQHLAEVQRKLAAGVEAGAAVTVAVPQDDDPSSVRLIADVEWIQPGSPFRLGILFSMRDHWHVYWMNPGDSGIPPMIEWQWPAGYSAEARSWPHPQRFEDPAGITFGHEDTLLLSWTVQPPDDLEDGPVTFAASVDWLVCKNICIAQYDQIALELMVRDDVPPPAEHWRAFFEQADARAPVSLPGWVFRAMRVDAGTYRLTLTPPEGVPSAIIMASEFFPSQTGFIRAGDYQWHAVDQTFMLTLATEGPAPDDGRLRGVLVLPDSATVDGEWPHAVQIDAVID